MVFNSYAYIGFLIAVFCLYWTLERRAQNLLLLAGSYLFYGWGDPRLVLLLAGYTAVNYSIALLIERFPAYKGRLLAISVAASLGVLGYFKYIGFLVDTVIDLGALVGLNLSPHTLNIILPIGISFYTFQTLGYVIDVYRGGMRASRNVVEVALFVAFFPQLIAGPIERASHMLSQFAQPRRFDAERAQSGVALIVWGLFKKVVIADTVGFYADRVFLLEDPGFALLWAGVFAFGIQIYADFSAYSDIARGSSRLLGIELVRNFRHPYLARSPSDFWQRWHISLSMWFRDYVYIPLGGSRRATKVGNVAVLFVTFAATGLWHGASWTFVLWGLIHATAILAHRALKAVTPAAVRQARATGVIGWATTFVVVHVGWLTFRETDPGHMMQLLAQDPLAVTGAQWREAAFLAVLVAFYSIPLWIHAYLDERTNWLQRLEATQGHARLGWMRAAGAVAGSVAIALLGADSAVPFIYFQF